jgi:tRNA(Ile)-lysidine synthase
MLEQFKKYLVANCQAGGSVRILLAVSGGIDSMVMAHLFITAGIQTGIAHCNFKLRGVEADKDEEFVKGFAVTYNIPFYSIAFDTSGYATRQGISIQMAARDLRFNWFEEIREKHGYNLVALAHNLNDNVETFLINLTRGTGITGLTGMKPRAGNIIRPLLFATREEITEFGIVNNISFREDHSNSEVKYTRNRIRHLLLPLFREINPSFESTIIETAQRLGEVNEILKDYISGIRDKLFSKRDNYTVFGINKIKNIPFKRTVIFELFRSYGLGPGQLDNMVDLVTRRESGTQLFTETHRFLKNRHEIIITSIEPVPDVYYEIRSTDDLLKVPGIISATVKKVTGSFTIPVKPGYACLDYAKVIFPLIIRTWVPGDSFYPFGMKEKKKLSDYFIDKKYSVYEKERSLIVESSGKIVWIIGERIDNRYRITASTKNALVIRTKRKRY